MPEEHIPGYTVLGKLAEGGMGAVFEARREATGERVAIKLMAPRQWERPELRGGFLREAILLSTLRHPNLCRLVESGECASGRLFVATELMTGQTLERRLVRGGLPVGRALSIATQVAAGLAAVHEAGIVHRDVKPGNVMVLPDGSIKVLDFGLAHLAAALAAAPGETVVGTPHYAAPEQLRGEPTDARADLWSLGVVLYQTLTGDVPYPGAGPREVLAAVEGGAPRPLDAVCPEAPAALQSILDRALARDPEARWPTAEAMRQALEEARRGLAI